jgi:hypothetical protein
MAHNLVDGFFPRSSDERRGEAREKEAQTHGRRWDRKGWRGGKFMSICGVMAKRTKRMETASSLSWKSGRERKRKESAEHFNKHIKIASLDEESSPRRAEITISPQLTFTEMRASEEVKGEELEDTKWDGPHHSN